MKFTRVPTPPRYTGLSFGNGPDTLNWDKLLKRTQFEYGNKTRTRFGVSPPPQDSPTMVMLQFKVIMRNPNKSKFSMLAESHRPGLLEG